MVLYDNSLVRLNYDPATDILDVDCPDFNPLMMTEVKEAFSVIVDTVKHYDVKKLLIDSSKATIDTSDHEHKAVLIKFARDLMSTRLQKLARVGTRDILREKNVSEAREEALFSIAFQSFPEKAAALAWLNKN